MANKAELVSEVASKTKLTKKQVANTVDAILDSIQENLAKGEKVQLIGFGTFEVRHRAARKGRNPQTGDEIEIQLVKYLHLSQVKLLRMPLSNSLTNVIGRWTLFRRLFLVQW